MQQTALPALYGVIGYPLAQSLSPVLHNWGFHREGIDAIYLAWPFSGEHLPDFVKAFRLLSIRGASVTIPHKQTIIPFLDGMTDSARRVGAVNTLYWNEDRLWGDNTDVTGFCLPLRGIALRGALVIGAGGAARAVMAGLASCGVNHVFVTSRQPEAAEALAAEFGAKTLLWSEKHAFLQTECPLHARSQGAGRLLVVNTTPLGMKGKAEGASAFSAADMQVVTTPKDFLFYDIVYNPLETPFLARARARGIETLEGLTMFSGQAQEQFRLWTGHTLPLTDIRLLLLTYLQ